MKRILFGEFASEFKGSADFFHAEVIFLPQLLKGPAASVVQDAGVNDGGPASAKRLGLRAALRRFRALTRWEPHRTLNEPGTLYPR